MAHGNVFMLDRVRGDRLLRRAKMRDELVAEEVVVRPAFRPAPFRATENAAIKGVGGGEIADGNGEMKERRIGHGVLSAYGPRNLRAPRRPGKRIVLIPAAALDALGPQAAARAYSAANGPRPMCEKFTPLGETFFVAPQLTAADVAAAKALGVATIINNRPDGEEPGQPTGAEIAAAAEAAGLAYVEIPVGPAGLSEAHLDMFDQALAAADGPVLAYCRSGARSTFLRALAGVRAGAAVDAVLKEAGAAGYDLSAQRAMLDGLAAR